MHLATQDLLSQDHRQEKGAPARACGRRAGEARGSEPRPQDLALSEGMDYEN